MQCKVVADAAVLSITDIRRMEIAMFPEFRDVDHFTCSTRHGRYVYYAPSVFFRLGLVTEELVAALRDDPSKKTLSVGVGRAYLERFLVAHCGVRPDQIVLADLPGWDPPPGFQGLRFDMYMRWPDFGKQFDWIIFPHSVLLGSPTEIQFGYEQAKRLALSMLIRDALRFLADEGSIRMCGMVLPNELVRDAVTMLALGRISLEYSTHADQLAVFRRSIG